ncbi:MAG: HlyD family type I secretion periplasmic adaptor subunit [Selenomonadaceae bacterium]
MLKKIMNLYKILVSRFIGNGEENKLRKEEIEFLPAALEVVEMPPSPVGRKVLWTLFMLLLVVFIWVMIGQVDEVAVATGKIIPNGQVKTVQAEDKGVVKQIYVSEGQLVKKGEPLIDLDTTITAADVKRLRQQVAYFSLDLDRLTAEQNHQPFIPKAYPDLEPKDIAFQQNLYQSRLQEYNTKLAVASSTKMQNEANLRSSRAGYQKMMEQYAIAREQAERVEKLAAEEAISTFVMFDYQTKRIELEGNIRSQEAEISRMEWSITEAQKQIENVEAERSREIMTSIVDDRQKLSGFTEELKKAEEKDRLSHITAPIDGRVSRLDIHTVGGIVTPAQALMEIVPDEAVMQVEAWVENKDIGFVQPGQEAEVKVETFNFQKFGTIDANVVEVSPNAVEDKEKGRVYRVLMDFDKNSFNVNGKDVAISSGMTATGEIKIRKKRIIEFFLDPFRQYKSEALRER